LAAEQVQKGDSMTPDEIEKPLREAVANASGLVLTKKASGNFTAGGNRSAKYLVALEGGGAVWDLLPDGGRIAVFCDADDPGLAAIAHYLSTWGERAAPRPLR